jgi:hypothetical protein
MKKAHLSAVAFMLCLASSAIAGEMSEFHRHFTDTIGTAHGIKAYREYAVLKVDTVVTFGGKVRIDGTMTFDTPVGKTRIENKDGTVMVFDGRDAWVAPADAPMPPTRARFALLTWPYFVAAPFKLADPGTHIDDAGQKPLDAHRILPAGKLTFGEGVGDSPDDWYMVYRDPDTGRLAALAYIVTYGQSTHDAEKSPHLAIYDAFEEVDGAVLPMRISFWNWETSTGKVGEQIGSVELSNYRFIEPNDDTFTKPENARIDQLPPPAHEG